MVAFWSGGRRQDNDFVVVENASKQAAESLSEGKLLYRKDNNTLYVSDGVSWIAQGGTGGVTVDNDYRVVADATERNALTQSSGLRVWQEDTNACYTSNGSSWVLINGSSTTPNDTFFVSTTGDDTTGNGSRSQPWRTLKKAVTEANLISTSANPVTIQMEPGIYQEDNGTTPIAITAAGITIKGDSPNAVKIQPSDVNNVLVTVSVDETYFQGLQFRSVTNNTAVQLSGTNAVQRFVEVSFVGNLDALTSANTGTLVIEGCVFVLNTRDLSLTAGEIIGGDLAFLGSGNSASPAGAGVTLSSGTRSLMDTVRMSACDVGYNNGGGTVISYNHDIVDCNKGFLQSSGASVILGGTIRTPKVAGIEVTGGGVRCKSSSFNSSGGVGNAIDLNANSICDLNGVSITAFAKGVTVTGSGNVGLVGCTFAANTVDLEQADSGSVVTSLSCLYTSTKVVITNVTNFAESSFLSDIRRNRVIGDTEIQGIQVFSIEDTEPSAESGKVLLYVRNSTDPTNTQLLLRFNDGTGSTTFLDSSSSARAIVAVGNTIQSAVRVKFGVSSGLFDGAGDYLTIANKTNISWATDFTIEGWINPITFSNNDVIFANTTDSNNTIRLDSSSGSLRCLIIDGGVTVASLTGAAVALDTWSHVAVVRSGNVYTLYLNGVSQASATSAAGVTSTFTSSLYLGARTSGANNFEGYMDEFRISSEARYSGSFNLPRTPFDLPTLFGKLPDSTVVPIGGL